MNRLLSLSILLIVFVIGCNKQPDIPAVHKYDPFGFIVEIETVGSYSVAIHDNAAKELAEYSWGSNKLRIEQGKLTFNAKDLGVLEKGDRVRVDKDSQLFVNGKQRP